MSNSNNKAIKAGIGYTVGNYLLKGLTFFTIPIFARLLNPSDYGLYNIFVAYESILFVVIGLAIHSSYKNARYKYGIDIEAIHSNKSYYNYISTTLVMLILLGFGWLVSVNVFSAFLTEELGLNLLSLNLLVLFSFGSAVITCFNVDASLQYKYQSFLKVAGINAIGNLILSILLINTVFDENRYMGRVVGSTIPLVVLAVFIIYSFMKQAKPGNYKEFLSWGVRYSLPIVPHGISQIILSQFGRVMINNMVNSSAAGIFSFAYNIYNILWVTANSLDNVWTTWFYEKMHQKEYTSIKEKSSLYMIFMLVFSVTVMLISPELIKFLGTKAYDDAIYCVIPIIAGGYFAFLYTIPAGVEYFYEKSQYIALGTMLAAVVNIGLNYVCINKYGYVSVAYITLITYLIYFFFHYILAWKIHGEVLFDNRVVISCTVLMILTMCMARFFIDCVYIRWFTAILIFVLGLLYEENQLGLIKRFVDRKGNN